MNLLMCSITRNKYNFLSFILLFFLRHNPTLLSMLSWNLEQNSLLEFLFPSAGIIGTNHYARFCSPLNIIIDRWRKRSDIALEYVCSLLKEGFDALHVHPTVYIVTQHSCIYRHTMEDKKKVMLLFLNFTDIQKPGILFLESNNFIGWNIF